MADPRSSAARLGPYLQALAALLVAAGATPAQVLRHEQGVPGTRHRQPSDVLVADRPVHEETIGGCDQELLALASGAQGEIAAVWSDLRHGSPVLYLGILASDGTPRQESPLHEYGPGASSQPSLAFGSQGRGAVTWTMTAEGARGVVTRKFAVERGAAGPLVPLRAAEPERGLAAPTQSALALGPDGNGAAVWNEGGFVGLQRLPLPDNAFALGKLIAPEGPRTSGMPAVVLSPTGTPIVAWTSPDGIARWSLSPQGGAAITSAGPGELLDLLVDATTGGLWLLVEHESELVLRHLSPAGERDRDDRVLFDPAPISADLCGFAGSSLALALELDASQEGQAASAVVVQLFGPSGEPLDVPAYRIAVPPDARPSRPRVVWGNGALVVAWTDRRSGDADVYQRRISLFGVPDDRLGVGPEERWNTDRTSAAQDAPELCAGASGAVICWRDARTGPAGVQARCLAPDGSFSSAEIEVDDASGRPCAHPAVARLDDGRFLVTWFALGDGEPRLCARAFGADGAPLGTAIDVGAPHAAAPQLQSAVAALRSGRGYVVVWSRFDGALMGARLSPQGKLENGPWELTSPREGVLRRPVLTSLDDGRVLAVWEQLGAAMGPLRGTFVAEDGRPDGIELAFEAGPDAWMGDPSVQPSASGFLIAFAVRTGEQEDVFARLYGPDARPASTLIPLGTVVGRQGAPSAARLADGSFAVAWRDDIAGRDQCLLRRISADGRTVGPVVVLHERTESFADARAEPRLAALGTGLLGAWVDLRRGRGPDVFARLLGPQFDRRDTAAR